MKSRVSHAWAALLITGVLGCRTAPKLPPANLSEPGWKVHQGQAVWLPQSGEKEIAGELLVATHTEGRAMVQFTKTPFPIVVAQNTLTNWQVEFPADGRNYAGRGNAPARIGWLQLPRALKGESLQRDWDFQRLGGTEWVLKNKATGESLQGYLSP